ncbi:MAG: hypothetical protein KatS3mg023_2671 [Armatimonadota bacterium]|nr:MAG: hypothetical protein KatS3mg023_2671 [Armatimonadota bacterium]
MKCSRHIWLLFLLIALSAAAFAQQSPDWVQVRREVPTPGSPCLDGHVRQYGWLVNHLRGYTSCSQMGT